MAGTGDGGFSGDGSDARRAQLHAPHDLTFGRESNLLVADTWNHRIRRIDRNGIITTIAGTVPGFGGDGGPAIEAQINLPMAVAAAKDGSIYLSDSANSRIRRIDANGMIRTIIGYGPGQDLYGAGFTGDGGPLEKARVFSATDLKIDSAGALYISDSGNNQVRVVRDNVISTVAGSGRQGFDGDGSPATGADLNTPQKLCIAADGSLFIADRANRRVRKLDSRGIMHTVAGNESPAGMFFDR